MSQWISGLEMVLAAFFWGFGFIATVWVLQVMGPLWATASRFGLAFALGLLLILVWPSQRRFWNRQTLAQAFVPGLLLSLTLILQTWGLQYTSAGRSGFITGLYVVFVPLLESWWAQTSINYLHLLVVAVALLGTALMVNLTGGGWNIGDLITFGCTLFASWQICWLGRISGAIASPLNFNILQCFWAALVSLPFALILENLPRWPQHWQPWAGMLSLVLGSTWIAFSLQIRAQGRVSAATASLLFLLESPIALGFSIWLLSERVAAKELLGAGLILLACVLAIWVERIRVSTSSSRSVAKK